MLQELVADWHRARFPHDDARDVVLKAVTEMGEVAEAILTEQGRNSAKEPGDVLEEAGDVVIALMALCARYGYGDLLESARRKYERLNTPGAHRASISARSNPGKP
jgi:NTP pyrophosphatase (non-canonical NTP hydrolase)